MSYHPTTFIHDTESRILLYTCRQQPLPGLENSADVVDLEAKRLEIENKLSSAEDALGKLEVLHRILSKNPAFYPLSTFYQLIILRLIQTLSPCTRQMTARGEHNPNPNTNWSR